MFSYIDLILSAIVIFFVFTGAKRGFTRTLLSFLARIISLITAYVVSDMYADVVYEKLLKDDVVNAIAENFKLDVSVIKDVGISETVSASLEEVIAGPLTVVVCRIVIFAAVSAVASIVLSILVNLICKIVKLPVLRTANKILGALLGLLNGLICVFILSFICTIATGFVDNAEFAEMVNSSYIIDYFAYADMLI